MPPGRNTRFHSAIAFKGFAQCSKTCDARTKAYTLDFRARLLPSHTTRRRDGPLKLHKPSGLPRTHHRLFREIAGIHSGGDTVDRNGSQPAGEHETRAADFESTCATHGLPNQIVIGASPSSQYPKYCLGKPQASFSRTQHESPQCVRPAG